MRTPVRLVTVLALLTSCGVGTELDNFQPQLSEALPFGGALVYLESTTGDLIIVDPNKRFDDGKKRTRRVDVGTRPTTMVRRPKSRAVPEAVVVIDPGTQSIYVLEDIQGDVERLPLEVPLAQLALTPDGTRGVAYHLDDTEAQRSVFAFPNTIAFVDFESGDVEIQSLGSSTARPMAVFIPEPIELRGVLNDNGSVVSLEERAQVGLLFVQGGIVLVDLDNRAAGPIVPLGTTSQPVTPAQVAFTGNRGDDIRGAIDSIERAYVRSADGALYAFALSLSPARIAGDLDAMAVSVSLENIIAGPGTAHDTALYWDPQGTELLIAAAGEELLLVNGFTGVAQRFPQVVFTNRLFSYQDDGRDYAIAYGQGGSHDTMLRVDPLGLNQRRSTGVRTLPLHGPLDRIERAADGAVLYYDDAAAIGLMELSGGNDVVDIQFSRPAMNAAVSAEGRHLWVIAEAADGPHLAEISLQEGLAAHDVALDVSGTAVGLAGGSLYVSDNRNLGSVTFFPRDDLRRDVGFTVPGIGLIDLFNSNPNDIAGY